MGHRAHRDDWHPRTRRLREAGWFDRPGMGLWLTSCFVGPDLPICQTTQSATINPDRVYDQGSPEVRNKGLRCYLK